MSILKPLRKRGLALFLALTMCLSLVQVTAFAEEDGGQEPADSIVTDVTDLETLPPEEDSPEYAAVEELEAAFEAVGEVLETGDVEGGIAALDEYLRIFSRLSPEDQEANQDARDAAEAYRQTLADSLEGIEDEDIEAMNTYDQITVHYVVNGVTLRTDTLNSGRYIQIANRVPYVSDLIAGTAYEDYDYGTVTKIECRPLQYFPSSALNLHEGQNIEHSGNYKTHTITYTTSKWEKHDSSGVTDPGTSNPPGTSGGSGSYFLQVVYVNKSKTEYSFGPRIASSSTARIWYYDNRPQPTPEGYELVGWQTSHYHGTNNFLNKNWWQIFGGSEGTRLYVFRGIQSSVVLNNGEGVYLIYQATQDPAPPATYSYLLTWDYNGGTLNGKSSDQETAMNLTGDSNATHTFYEQTSKRPSRSGYTFTGWAYSGNGNFNASNGQIVMTGRDGSTVSGTMVAQWRANSSDTVTLTYDANGGNNPPAAQTVAVGAEATVAGKGSMTKDNHIFLGWSRDHGATEPDINPDDVLRMDESLTIYAVWKLSPSANYTVAWYDTEGNPLKAPETRSGTVGTTVSVTEEDKKISEYTFDEDNADNITSAALAASGTVLRLYFKKAATAAPALTITKSVDKSSVKVGGTLEYTITVTNSGEADAANVVVTDTLPNELTYVIKSTRGADEASATGNTLTWNLGTIRAGSKVQFTFKATADKSGSIENSASVTSTEITTPVPAADPAVTAIYNFAVTKKNDGFQSVKGSGKATVHYTVTVTNTGDINLYGLNIKDVLTPVIKVDNAAVTAGQAEMVLKNVTVTGSNASLDGQSLSVTDTATTTWNGVIARDAVFAPEAVVKVEYDIEITNKTDQQLYVDLNNTATCGTWTSAPPSPELLSMRSSDDNYVEESAGSSASTGSSGTGGTIDPADPEKTVTVTWVDEDGTTQLYRITDVKSTEVPDADQYTERSGKEIPTKPEDEDYTYTFKAWEKSEDTDGNVTYKATYTATPKTPTPPGEYTVTVRFADTHGNTIKPSESVSTANGGQYDVRDRQVEISGYRYLRADGALTGTVTADTTITLTYVKQVTVTWVDENGNTVQGPVTIDEGSGYSNPADRDGNGHWGDPEEDANGNITIRWVPGNRTVTWLSGYGANRVLHTDEIPWNTTVVPGRLYPADPTRSGYTFRGWDDPVIGGDGNITITALWRYTGGTGGGTGGGGGGGGTTTTPPTTTIPDTTTPLDPGTSIDDQDVPLAGTVGLNDTDHFAYIIGRDEDHVYPLANITRAEAATIFFRLMTEDFRVANWSATNSFTDVKAGDWYNNAISTCAKAGILMGREDGRFDPDASITRAEFAAIAARFLDDSYTDDGTGDFADTANHWAAKEIRLAAKAGWITGSGSSFNPEARITRAEVMTIVNRMLDRTPDKDHMLPEMKKWVDCPEDAWYYEAVQEATNEHDYTRDETSVETWTALKEGTDWAALELGWAANNGASASAVQPETQGLPDGI